MFIKRGTSRLVVCLPEWGLVIKLPRPRPLSFIRNTAHAVRRAYRCRQMRWIEWSLRLDHNNDNDLMGNIRYTLLNGIWHNWQEWRLWGGTRSRFLEPTYFSLLGLVNIQRYGEDLRVSDIGLWAQMVEFSEGAVWSNAHHFGDPSNFSYRGGIVRMRDYGGRGVAEVVKKYGETIVASFDPDKPPSWN